MATDLPGKRKLTALEHALKEVVEHEFFQLTVEQTGIDEETEAPVFHMVCPHCKSHLGDDDDDLIAVDFGLRRTPNAVWTTDDMELQQVRFQFLDSPQEHIPYVQEQRPTVQFEDTLYYLCGYCGNPVALPKKYEEQKGF